MAEGKLTSKQEAFCAAFIEVRDASAAYRRTYDASKMTAKSVNESASRLLKNVKVAARVSELSRVVVEDTLLTVESHLARLKNLSEAAESEGKYAAAVTAEMARGKVQGFYIDKIQAEVTVIGMAERMRQKKGTP